MNIRYEDIRIESLDNIVQGFGSLKGKKLTDFLENVNPNVSKDMAKKNHWTERFKAEGIPFVVQQVSDKQWKMWTEDKTISNKEQIRINNRKDMV